MALTKNDISGSIRDRLDFPTNIRIHPGTRQLMKMSIKLWAASVTDNSLSSDTIHLVVTETKMFSKHSAGVKCSLFQSGRSIRSMHRRIDEQGQLKSGQSEAFWFLCSGPRGNYRVRLVRHPYEQSRYVNLTLNSYIFLTSFEILDKEILKNNMKTYISLSF
jgi:hypothetical protein